MKRFLLLLSLVLFLGSCASNPYKGCRQNPPQKDALDKAIADVGKADTALSTLSPRSCIVDNPKLFATMTPVEVHGRMVPYIIVSSKLLDRIPSKDHLKAVVAYQLVTFLLSNSTIEAPYGIFPHEYVIDKKTRDVLAAANVNEPEKVLFETLEWIQSDYPTLKDRKERLLTIKKFTPGGKEKKGQ